MKNQSLRIKVSERFLERVDQEAEARGINRSQLIRIGIENELHRKATDYKRDMEKELQEFFLRCMEAVEVLSQRKGNDYNDLLESIADDMEEVAKTIRDNKPEEVLEY